MMAGEFTKVSGKMSLTLGAELLKQIGLKPGLKYSAEAISNAFHVTYDALIDQLGTAAESAKASIKAELVALKASHDLARNTQEIPKGLLKNAEKVKDMAGILTEKKILAAKNGLLPRGLVDTLFKDSVGNTDLGKVAGAVAVVGAVVAAVVAWFCLSEEKPTAKVDNITDAELLATLSQRQV